MEVVGQQSSGSSGAGAMPAAEVDVDVDLVRRLLQAQHPDLAALPLRELANGWDNVIYRLGDQHVVRLPRRQLAAVLVEHEQRWLPALAAGLPLPVPAPTRVGRPALGYPWSWSICPWFDGEIAATAAIDDRRAEARRLGRFVAALHRPSPPDAPPNAVRGGPLADRADAVAMRLDRLAATVDAPRIGARWRELAAATPWQGPPLWIHGDLHSANVIVDDRRISAVVDFGDITGGDPATDLAVAWMLFDDDDRATFRDACRTEHDPVDDDTWARARAWALHLALAYLASSADSATMHDIGQRLLASALDAPG
jgi:aminoglycoside phosphotransferase (APT) family kinase protein